MTKTEYIDKSKESDKTKEKKCTVKQSRVLINYNK